MGTVYLVGAGPGDPGLITLNGIELLKTCDAVIYDRLASYQLLEYLKEDCVKIYVGKEPGCHSKTQEEINRIIIKCAGIYDQVVRLKGGDSFVFGRGGEEIEELQKYNIPYEVIPGVTSAVSVPESAGIPVTHRGMSRSFHVITGHTKDTDHTLTDNYEQLARLDGTLVFLMGLSNLKQIADKLIENGKDGNTPAAVISNGTRSNAKTLRAPLKRIAFEAKEREFVSPAVIVVGETAALELLHTVDRPLSGIKIGITGTRSLRDKLNKGLQKLGAQVFTVCDMHLVETPYISQLIEEIRYIKNYQWIVFTSQNAIKLFFDKMIACRVDRRCLSHIKFAVIGGGTRQALQDYGYIADFIPEKFTTSSLAEEFVRKVSRQENVLIPRALRGSEELTKMLIENEISYKEIPIYDVEGKLTENKEYLPDMDCLVFVSASGVSAFFDEMKASGKELQQNIKIACIGDVTVEALKKYNRNADIIADVSTADGLIDEIRQYRWALNK